MKDVAIVIPTYGREEILIATVAALLEQQPRAREVIVVDQTESHDRETDDRLTAWDEAGAIRRIALHPPSITAAMNAGLKEARQSIVLFLDDDIVPGPGLVGAHSECYSNPGVTAVVGKVIRPGYRNKPAPVPADRGKGIWQDLEFLFDSEFRTDVANCMAGNLSVRREQALAAGGFDENFKGVAYRFETEFCRRLLRAGGRLIYEPAAVIRHLQAPRGGTRTWGNPLTSASPAHSEGEYYFAFKEGRGWERWHFMAWRFGRSVRTRFHLTHPWWIPVKLLGEVRGLVRAYGYYRSGRPRLID